MFYKLQARHILLESRLNDLEDMSVKVGWSKSNWNDAKALEKEIEEIRIKLVVYDEQYNITIKDEA